MRTQLTVVGNLTSNPTSNWTKNGTRVVEFGLAHNDRRQDRTTGLWEDYGTTFYTVTCWRKVAENVGACLQKGDAVVVHGSFSTHEYERRDGTVRSELKLEATAVGADLARVMATVIRIPRPAAPPSSVSGDPSEPMEQVDAPEPQADPFDEMEDEFEPDQGAGALVEAGLAEVAPGGRD